MNLFVTGGAGFIGSNFVDSLLMQGHDVTAYDNLSTGKMSNLEFAKKGFKKTFHFYKGDLNDIIINLKGIDKVYHFAAHADVREGINDSRIDLRENTLCTLNLLNMMKRDGVKDIVFISTSSVYGEPDIVPTPEDYFGIQTSLYGASKVAAEQLVTTYANYNDWNYTIFRLVSQMGQRYSHGCIVDFIAKLKNNKWKELEVLGDGKQKKSYLHVSDTIRAINMASGGIYNVSHKDWVTVDNLIKIMLDELRKMKVVKGKVKITHTGGERGWKGDSPLVLLDTTKLQRLGWRPQVSQEQAIRDTTRWVYNGI